MADTAQKIVQTLYNEARYSGCGRSKIAHGVFAELVLNGRAVIWYVHENGLRSRKISHQDALERVAASVARGAA